MGKCPPSFWVYARAHLLAKICADRRGAQNATARRPHQRLCRRENAFSNSTGRGRRRQAPETFLHSFQPSNGTRTPAPSWWINHRSSCQQRTRFCAAADPNRFPSRRQPPRLPASGHNGGTRHEKHEVRGAAGQPQRGRGDHEATAPQRSLGAEPPTNHDS